MTAVSSQPLPIEPAARPTLTTANRVGEKLAALGAVALGFLGFMPYPAINVGNTSAVQFGNLLTLLLLAPFAGALIGPGRFITFRLLMFPVCLSTLMVAAAGGDDLSLSLKFTAAWGLACLAVVVVQVYGPRYSLELLTGIAAATIVHVGVGLRQFYSFRSEQFPLVELYVNQSFLSVQENVNVIARYIQRPFGLFPEPSAMSSSLAPWVIFIAAYFGGLIQLRREPTVRMRLLFAIAAMGGLILIILSRSGHAAITLAALGVIGLVWAVRVKANPRTHLAVIGAAAIVLPFVLTLAAAALGDRVGGTSKLGNSSWEERTSSLVIGFGLLTDGGIGTSLFGLGPGLSSPAMQDVYALEAVWSIVLGYIYETGLVGVVAVGWIGRLLFQTWRSVRYSVAFAAFACVWLVGITVTTSYSQLLPIWIALGWLTVWPSVCGTGNLPVSSCSESKNKDHGQVARVTAGGAS